MSYVVAGYLVTFVTLSLYGVSLWWRGRRDDH
jgi:hypothetical protein